MNYMSVCSGVEAASLAWEGLGWKPVAFSEIEPFPCAVLAERFPCVPNLGDMTKIEVTDDGISGAGFTIHRKDVELLVGGTPCQSFSVAGRREGLKGASGLAFHFVRLLREIQPKWFVWENVPGALSSRTDGQLDFNFLVGAFAECGYCLAWRILDAQYVRSKSFPFAIPQRRRRLFVVGCLGDGESAGKVLFDGESLSGDTPPRRTTAQEASCCSERSLGMSVRMAHTKANGCGIGVGVAHTLGASDVDAVWWDWSDKADTMTATSDAQRMPDKGRLQCVIVPAQNTHDSTCVFTKEAHPRNSTEGQAWRETGVAKTLNTFCTGETRAEELIVVYENHAQDSRVAEVEISPTINCMGGGSGMLPLVLEERNQGIPTIRRLTPKECERLMGFPDNWTRIPWRGKPSEQCPDGPRYKACGNSMCVNCMEWIGERIEKVERELQEEGR